MSQRCSIGGFVAGLIVACAGVAGSVTGAEVDLPRYPSISPDGKQVVFSWRGDLWRVGAEGGQAVRLTSHPADETASAWSPDGQWVAFESTRAGRRNIFVMRPDGGDVRQVTFEDATLNLTGFSADGSRILLSGSIEGDVYRSERPYTVSFEGGPLTRLHGAFGQAARANPDGERFVFERGGSSWVRRHYRGPDDRDLFLFNESDGSFTRVTSWTGNDGRAVWRDEDTLVYMSDRGAPDGAEATVAIWTVDLGSPEDEAVRLTEFGDRDITAFDVSADGRAVVFLKWGTLYTAKFKGRRLDEPRALVITAPDDAFPKSTLKDVSSEASEAAISPDGKVMAYVAFGDVYVRAVEEGSPTRRVTDGMARERDIAWSPDMSRLYFVSDSGGTDSIYAATVSLTRGEVKERFQEATKVTTVAAEPVDESVTDEPAEPVADAAPDPGEEKGSDDHASGDGDKKKDKEPEKPKISERWHDAVRFDIAAIVDEPFDDRSPTPSPDGKRLAFKRTRGDLVILDLITGESRTVVESWDIGLDGRWSPDGDYLAYSVDDSNFNSDIYIAPADGSWAPVNISRHPDNDISPRWSGDGKILAFLSERENDEMDVYTLNLDRDLDGYSKKDWEDYFEERSKAVKKLGVIEPIAWTPSAEVPEESEAKPEADTEKPAAEEKEPPFNREDLDDAYRRLRRMTSYPGSESGLEITPAGDRLVFSASGGTGGVSGVYSIKRDGSDERKLTSGGRAQQVAADGAKLVVVQSGRVSTVGPAGGSEERLPLEYTVPIDWRALSGQKFGELARTLGRTFYHPTMKDVDWSGLSAQYGELAGRAYTSGEFAEVASRLMGELNASHLGVSPSPDYSAPDYRSSGRLGVVSTPVDGGFRVDRVLPRSRPNAGEMRLMSGDVITAIELKPIGLRDTLDGLLAGRVGVETIVTVQRGIDPDRDGPAAAENRSIDLLITPVSSGEENQLAYDHWQLSNAAKVAEWSGGRLGYLHIRSMGGPDLNEYERDLYAAADGKAGLLVDVRSNGGGWTADRVLASLMYPQHAYTIPRGADPEAGQGYPRDRLYIQRYNGPVNMLCNEKSFSNAEIVSHAFKTLKRGTLVGQQTYGGVISTGAFSLVDGTTVRQPFRGWYLADGTDMENNGAVPDIIVEQTPEDESAGMDAQIKAAVEELLKRID